MSKSVLPRKLAVGSEGCREGAGGGSGGQRGLYVSMVSSVCLWISISDSDSHGSQ